jgi:hypothetical protein
MRQITMTTEISKPTPENVAIETNWAASESGGADGETSAFFGMAAVQFSGQKAPIFKCPSMTMGVQAPFRLSANPPQGRKAPA